MKYRQPRRKNAMNNPRPSISREYLVMREKSALCRVSSSIIHWITMGTESWAISTRVRDAIPVRNEYL